MKRRKLPPGVTTFTYAHNSPLSHDEAYTVAEVVRLNAALHGRAMIVAVIPLPDGSAIGELMTIEHWGHDGPPHCTCGDDTHDHMCAHIRMIAHLLNLHDTTAADAGS